MTTVRRLLTFIEELAPARLAAQWDNCGLMVGEVDRRIQKVAVALDATTKTLESAHEHQAQVLLTHHPLIFKPLKKIDYADPVARTIALAVRLDMVVVAAHTNLDAAKGGVGQALARLLDLRDCQVLDPSCPEKQYKLVVFVPLGYEDTIRQAAFGAGAGHISGYQECSFAGRGEGTFRAPDGADPFVRNRPDGLQRVPESRLEINVDSPRLDQVKRAVLASHPYEEAACDVYPLAPDQPREGFGIIGSIAKTININELVSLVKHKLETGPLKVAGPLKSKINRVALMPGSGGGYVKAAGQMGADVLITGDVGYHQAREAEDCGLCIIDAGHFGTEYPILSDLAAGLRQYSSDGGAGLEFIVLTDERDPWLLMEG